MRLALLAPALLLLAACDSSDPAADLDLTANTFEARITAPSGERVVTGTAAPELDERSGMFGSFPLGEDGRYTITTIQLDADEGEETFAFAGITDRVPVEGTRYTIGFNWVENEAPGDSILALRGPGTFVGAYLIDSDSTRTIGLGSDGGITFTEVSDDVLAGSFRFETRAIFVSGAGVLRTEPITVEGAFRTDRRERLDPERRR
jgi:hypothetical protein